MSLSRDYPKLLTPELQAAIRDHDLAEATRLFRSIGDNPAETLELWAELLDELSHHGRGWAEWADHWPGGETALTRPVYFLVLGILALQEESFEHAGYYLQRCAETSPTSPVPLAYMGIMYESQGCPSEALGFYRRCLTLAPTLFSVLNASGNLLHELGFYEEAVSHYNRALPLLAEPCNQAILLGNLGNSQRALGLYEEAIATYTEAVALDPGQPSIALFLAEILLEVRRGPHVVACLTDMILLPTFDEWPAEAQQNCYGLLARAYVMVHRFPAATFYYWLQNGCRLDEDDREGVSTLLKALFGWAITEPGTSASEFLLAKLNRHLGYLDAALHHAKRAVKIDPEQADHFIELGAALLLQEKRPVALEAFEEAAVLAPERAEIHCFLALASWEDEPEDAANALAEAIRLEPNQALHHCDMAYLSLTMDDEPAARLSFQRALLLWDRAPILYGTHGPATQRGCYSDVTDPYLTENANSPVAGTRLLTAANFLILAGRRDAARKALHRLLSEQPAQLNALRNYAWLLGREGWTQEALSIWRRVLVADPEDDISRFFALRCLSGENVVSKESVVVELENRLAQRPDYHLGRLLLAKLLEPGLESLAHFEVLCARLPEFYSTWYWLGQSHFHRRHADLALPCLSQAVALNPAFGPARQLLSQCHRQLGNLAASHHEQAHFYLLSGKYHLARSQFDQALAIDTHFEAARKGIRQVERRLSRLENPHPRDLYGVICPRFRVD